MPLIRKLGAGININNTKTTISTLGIDKSIKMFTFLVLMVLVVSPCLGQEIIFDGPCPNVEVIENFNHEKFQQGYWYVIQRYTNSKPNDCVRLEYTWKDMSRLFYAEIREYDLITNKHKVTLNGLREKDQLSNDGQFTVYWTNADYNFVDTDYKNYAVIWTCLEFRDTQGRVKNGQNLMVMARDRTFDINSMASINATLDKKPFIRSMLKNIEQKDKRCYDFGK